MINLSTIKKLNYSGKLSIKTLPKSFRYVCIDSRKACPEDVFIALKGENNDAHLYMKDILEKGTALVIVNESWFKENASAYPNGNFMAVKDTTIALGELARIHRQSFPKLKVIGVGGSNGKTTTKELLACVLSAKYNVLKTEGNFNNHIGVPLTLLRLEKKHQMAVIEMGCNHFNEIRYLCEIAEPDYGVITNIGKEHLEFFKNKAGVAKAEFELIDWMEKAKKKPVFFANMEDPFIAKRALQLKSKQRVRFGYSGTTEVKGKFLGYTPDFHPLLEIKTKSSPAFKVEVNTFGKHSIYNGLSATAVGIYLNIDPKKIAKQLKTFVSSSSKRMEITEHLGYRVINDAYNSNPDSVILGLDTLSEYKGKGKCHVVLGDMLELGKVSAKEHELIGKHIDRCKLKYCYTFGPDSKHTTSAIKKALFSKHYKDKTLLIKDLMKQLKADDLVYVKGSRGMKMEEVVNALLTR